MHILFHFYQVENVFELFNPVTTIRRVEVNNSIDYEDPVTDEMVSEEDIIAMVKPEIAKVADSEPEVDEIEPVPVKIREALAALSTIQKFMEENDYDQQSFDQFRVRGLLRLFCLWAECLYTSSLTTRVEDIVKT